jgi:hypothetical protein
MVYGTLLHIEAESKEDVHLYGNPKLTYFKSVFRKGNNFAIEYNKLVKESNKIKFGDTIHVKIPHSGDLLAGIYLDFKLKDLKRTTEYIQRNLEPDPSKSPRFTSYSNGIGYNIIDTVELFIGGHLVQKLNSELIYIMNELKSDYNQTQYFYHNTKYHEDFSIGNMNHTNVRCHVSLPLYFTNNPGVYLPLGALIHSKIELRIKLRTFEQCIVREYNPFDYDPNNYITTPGVNGYKREDGSTRLLPNPVPPVQYEKYMESLTGGIEYIDIITQTIFLGKGEQNYFLNYPNELGSLEYLVEMFHIGEEEKIEDPSEGIQYSIDMTAKHPTKYLCWVLQREDVFKDNFYQNYTYDYRAKYGDGFYNFDTDSHLLEDMEITMNNVPIFKDISPIFISNIQKYERFKSHASHPIYLYNFSLRPNHSNPSGSLNLSLFRNKTFKLTLANKSNYTNNNTKPNILFRYYTSYYNIISIESGLAGLRYK